MNLRSIMTSLGDKICQNQGRKIEKLNSLISLLKNALINLMYLFPNKISYCIVKIETLIY